MQSQITVELLGGTGLKNADIAIGTCWDKQTKEGGINFERMKKKPIHSLLNGQTITLKTSLKMLMTR